MVIMYTDEKTWKLHYDDWKKIIPTVSNDFRRKIIQSLIDDYERSDHE